MLTQYVPHAVFPALLDSEDETAVPPRPGSVAGAIVLGGFSINHGRMPFVERYDPHKMVCSAGVLLHSQISAHMRKRGLQEQSRRREPRRAMPQNGEVKPEKGFKRSAGWVLG